ncbi:AsmA-like C-terminal region-containing protein [Candidatus Pelagibacter sp.]|nr:AsmA-like C-terminal region-containing protein [Candidatus Pelagibacter sp.]
MRFVLKFLSVIFFLIVFSLGYLSIFGIETNKFNNQILNKVERINKDIKFELKKIKIVLNPFSLRLEAKTIGPKLIDVRSNNIIDLESIKTEILISSFFSDDLKIENIEISSKSLEIKNLISFLRSFYKNPELYILEKTIKKGYLIADIKLNPDNSEQKNKFEIKGILKETKLKFPGNIDIKKLNFIFEANSNSLVVKDLNFSLSDLDLKSKKILIQNKDNKYFVKGTINNENIELDSTKIISFIGPFVQNILPKKIKFRSENEFSFNFDKKLKFDDLEIFSKINISELIFSNQYKLSRFFPDIKDEIKLLNNQIEATYKKNNYEINGNGKILYQNTKDDISYFLNKKKEKINFRTKLNIKDDNFKIDFLNYLKDKKKDITIYFNGSKDTNDSVNINSFLIKEERDLIKIDNLKLDKSFKIQSFNSINFNFLDKENIRNFFKVYKNNKEYFIEGVSFNANKLIDNLLSKDENSRVFLDKKFKFTVDLKKVYLDPDHIISKFEGNISLLNQKIINANLVGNLADNKKINYLVKRLNENKKVTTLLLENAEPIIKRYKFIKGFEEGVLDFSSSSEQSISTSTLKIYNFKLKELPLLTKILTLASLQGIADILSGEGIRFNELEMNFTNKKNLLTIKEIYAIGPAISILMDGYIEKDKLVSLRGTLVPATTINKVISSIPILGKILVGSKTGEGVFGVSFKIKGPPKKLETTVNPIKTLTPRFITRTLEKLKKIN